MYVIGYFLLAVSKVLDLILLFFMWVIIARAILSWVSPDPYNPIVRFIHTVTEPVLFRIRALIPVSFGGIDFSPIIVIMGVVFLRTFVVSSIFRIARNLL